MRIKLSVLILVLLLFYPGNSSASVPLMSLEEVQVLLEKGPIDAYFESVPEGTKLRKYKVKIRGVYDEIGLKLIIFTSDHKIVAGMSGSPVYVSGKLIGAVAYAVNQLNFDHSSWGGISPISLMIEDSQKAKSGSTSTLSPKFSYKSMMFEPIPLGTNTLSGLGEKVSVSSGSYSEVGDYPGLKAGMPIVADLFEITDEGGRVSSTGALGTITYIDDNGKVYAFGHPFLGAKNVVLAFRTCRIMGTVYSELGSFKLGGNKSKILGTINYDSTYGIYGNLSLQNLSKLNNFSLELKRRGQSYKKFEVKISNSEMASTLASMAFETIGLANGAPIAEESAVTELKTDIFLEGHDIVTSSDLYPSVKVPFGTRVLTLSSYDVALRRFFDQVYSPLLRSPHGFKINNVKVSANFIPGELKKLKLGAYNFTNKVKWGENPVLDIVMVSEDNSIAIEKSVKLEIDWTKVEEPVYTAETKETDKESEKVVSGVLQIYTSHLRPSVLASSGSGLPDYFLNPGDFLSFFSNNIKMGNQTLFYSAGLSIKSGLLEKELASSERVVALEAAGIDGWHVINGGVKSRKTSLKNLGFVSFHWNLPSVPSGYIVDHVNEVIRFEVVR